MRELSMFSKPKIRMVKRVLIYSLCIIFSVTGAFLLRYEFDLTELAVQLLWQGLALAIPIKLAMFLLHKCHRICSRTLCTSDVLLLLSSSVISSIFFSCIARVTIGRAFPLSIYVMDFCLCTLTMTAVFMGERMRSELINNNRAKAPVRKRILIYGAGSGGVNLLREIREHSSWGVAVVGFLDDNRTNKGTDILGTRVLGCGR